MVYKTGNRLKTSDIARCHLYYIAQSAACADAGTLCHFIESGTFVVLRQESLCLFGKRIH